jgi:hypothetical protein
VGTPLQGSNQLKQIWPTLASLGAAGTVTVSGNLTGANGQRYLVNCGLFQGNYKLKQRNRETIPGSARGIDAIILTHAHPPPDFLGASRSRATQYGLRACRSLQACGLVGSGSIVAAGLQQAWHKVAAATLTQSISGKPSLSAMLPLQGENFDLAIDERKRR